MVDIIALQDDIYQKLTRLNANFNKDSSKRYSIGYFESKLNSIKAHWKTFNSNHQMLFTTLKAAERATQHYFSDNKFDIVEDFYLDLEAKIIDKREEFLAFQNSEQRNSNLPLDSTIDHNQSTFNHLSKNVMKLAPITIENFSGQFKKWTTFKNMFESLIHENSNLTTVHKMHYLKSSLSGDAARLLNQYDISAENYSLAWETLKKRYDNKRALVNTQLKALTSQSPVTLESANSLKHLLDTTSECLHLLSSLGIDTKNWDPIVVYLIVQKLDHQTHELWETSIKAPKELPTYKEFSEFLETRFNVLLNLEKEKTKSQPHNQNKKSFQQNSSNKTQHNRINPYRSSTPQGFVQSSFKPTNFHTQTEFKTKNKPTSSSHASHPLPLTSHASHQSPSTSHASHTSPSAHSSNSTPYTSHAAPSIHPNQSSCPVCNDLHSIFECKTFLSASMLQRKEIVFKFALCMNCLRSNHRVEDCTVRASCRKCKCMHSTLLHHSSKTVQATPSNSSSYLTMPMLNDENNEHQSSINTHFAEHLTISSQVLLATALVEVKAADGRTHIMRALLDQGSQCSFITESVAQFLRLPKKPIIAPIIGLGAVDAGTSKFMVDLVIKSRVNKEFSINSEALVLQSLTKLLPTTKVQQNNWNHITGLTLADPKYYVPNRIDLLLGADIYGYILLNGLRRGRSGTPVAQNTEFGWILSGHLTNTDHISNTQFSSVQTFHNRVELDDLLRKFWEIEELPKEKILSNEEQLCENIFDRTHTRNANGIYTVRIPFKTHASPPLILGSSRGQALSRFLQLEKRLERDPELKDQYVAFMTDYIALGHMSQLVPSQQLSTVASLLTTSRS